MRRKTSTLWRMGFLLPVLVAVTSMLTACFGDRAVVFVTGRDYIPLEKGEVFLAPRDMVLATESVIQEKDAQILDLLRVNAELAAQAHLMRSEE